PSCSLVLPLPPPCLHFRGFRDPRDLHSFPTRRSSDLLGFGNESVAWSHEHIDWIDRFGADGHSANSLDAAQNKYLIGPSHCLGGDRKSTRLNSSHVKISYAVFCLKKKSACRT